MTATSAHSPISDDAAAPSRPLEIFVDGSHDPRLNHGGWAFVVHDATEEIAFASGFIGDGDNGTAELTALLKALAWIEAHAGPAAVTLWSDAHYVVTGCNSWRHIWRNGNWRRRPAGGKGRIRTVPHADLWREIDAALTRRPDIAILWCKGHAEIIGNLRADELATAGRLSR